jgi:hypothetical protein
MNKYNTEKSRHFRHSLPNIEKTKSSHAGTFFDSLFAKAVTFVTRRQRY